MKDYIPPDNSVPVDPNYPTFAEAEFEYEKVLYVNDGDYIVDRDGRVEIVTSGNMEYKVNKAVYAEWNRGFLRARYLGNKDDAMEYANQIRKATAGEIKIAKAYEAGDRVKVLGNGQAVLL